MESVPSQKTRNFSRHPELGNNDRTLVTGAGETGQPDGEGQQGDAPTLGAQGIMRKWRSQGSEPGVVQLALDMGNSVQHRRMREGRVH